MNVQQYESIQDLLVSLGFTIDQEQGQFSKWHTGWQFIAIPFSEIAGHTVSSFIQKARQRGWLPEEEVRADSYTSCV
ncbi:MAG TPA: hypothetical protein VNN62_11650 [Methylomirabilota bacterium]|jgi:hypothetical protein|nr:hypothetical protein [Methylomirabilota bacterium]HZT34540.1 hypothetical protein [Nitrososphaera sp.]